VTECSLDADYVSHVASLTGKGKALKVAVDGANGMGGPMALAILRRLGHGVAALYTEPDGRFPNHEANPLRPENLRDLQALVRKEGADLGIAFDGDADRAIVVDERGETVPNDFLSALLAKAVLAQHPGAAIVYDLRSSWVLKEEIEKAGGVPVRERVGHSFIKATMRERKSPFGGELSGHTYWAENYSADSAMIAMVKTLSLLQETGRSLSSLLAPLKRTHATGELNFVVADKDAKIREVEQAFRDGKVDFLDGITVAYPDWWFNVRKSNTEPLLRLCLEAKTTEGKERGLKRVLAVLGEPETAQHA
jgi:phosphomannomutase